MLLEHGAGVDVEGAGGNAPFKNASARGHDSTSYSDIRIQLYFFVIVSGRFVCHQTGSAYRWPCQFTACIQTADAAERFLRSQFLQPAFSQKQFPRLAGVKKRQKLRQVTGTNVTYCGAE